MNSKMKKENITAVTNMIVLDVEGLSTAIIELTGTFVATLAFEYTINGDDWIALTANVQGASSTATSATAVGRWIANVAGFQQIRVRCTAYTSGTAEVLIRAVPGDSFNNINTAVGTQADAANTDATTSGSLIAFVKGLVSMVKDVWDSTLHSFGAHLVSAIAGEDLTNNVLGVQNKPIASANYSPSLYAPLTQVTKNVIKASAGNVLSIYITNDNAAVRYFQLHNKATAPAAGEAPIRSLKVPAGTANNPGVLVLGREFFGDGGEYFATGIGWAISTTFATFTDSATNTEHIVNVDYI